MISTYPTIASEFHDLSNGVWLLVAYSFAYCVSSPVVSAMIRTQKNNLTDNTLVWGAW